MKSLYGLIEKLGEISGNLLKEQLEPSSEKEWILLFAMAKSEKTLNAVVLLCKGGFGEDATILSRSLFELYWSVEYILSREDDYLAKRFFAYDWIARKEMYDYAKTTPFFLEDGKETTKEIEIKAQEMQEKYHFNKYRGWSDKSIWEISELLGHGNIYNTAYKIQCSFCHVNPRAANDYFKKGKDGEFILDAGPSNNLIKESLFSSALVYFGIIKAFNNYFTKGLDENISDMETKIKLIASEK